MRILTLFFILSLSINGYSYPKECEIKYSASEKKALDEIWDKVETPFIAEYLGSSRPYPAYPDLEGLQELTWKDTKRLILLGKVSELIQTNDDFIIKGKSGTFYKSTLHNYFAARDFIGVIDPCGAFVNYFRIIHDDFGEQPNKGKQQD